MQTARNSACCGHTFGKPEIELKGLLKLYSKVIDLTGLAAPILALPKAHRFGTPKPNFRVARDPPGISRTALINTARLRIPFLRKRRLLPGPLAWREFVHQFLNRFGDKLGVVVFDVVTARRVENEFRVPG